MVSRSRLFGYRVDCSLPRPTVMRRSGVPRPPHHNAHGLSRGAGLGCSRFARRYSGNRGCFLFLGVLRCFSSPSSRSPGYGFARRLSRMTGIGLPHSGIPGLTSACDYPGLIAACHALRRLLMPRHPPYTLSSLTPDFPSRSGNCSGYRSVFDCQRAPRKLPGPPHRGRHPGIPPFSIPLGPSRATLVEMSGIEPLTPCLQSRCSPN